MTTIIPGIFKQDLKALEHAISLVAPYAGVIQIDIADNTLVPVTTLLDPIQFTKLFAPYRDRIVFEAHMMVARPEQYARKFVAAGFGRLIGHVECDDPRNFLADARTLECEVGLAMDLDTPLDAIEPFLEEIDTILVMSAPAGASGQPFEESSLEKIRAIHRNFPDLPVEIDCGINETTAKLAKDAGATRIVSTSYIFNDENHVGEAIQKLQDIVE